MLELLSTLGKQRYFTNSSQTSQLLLHILQSEDNVWRMLSAGDMYRAYSDMREANWKDSDKYFHARGNYDAAKRGPGGAWAAEVISNARENWQGSVSGRGAEDTLADQEANEWGRSGGDPNRYRPRDLPEKY
uniref:Serum amyloid A protein n=1 Tax=Crocodylus porosus TaxID=8502 RepID=A0A7M4FJI2_CROPO